MNDSREPDKITSGGINGQLTDDEFRHGLAVIRAYRRRDEDAYNAVIDECALERVTAIASEFLERLAEITGRDADQILDGLTASSLD